MITDIIQNNIRLKGSFGAKFLYFPAKWATLINKSDLKKENISGKKAFTNH